ncbi:MAG TPA: Rieske 2Fe-2S domain-containing protein [Tepidisphaeraceae bacterium]|jgi:nitrite reductase/ring-hydroxylating ferredoxin subunit
MAWATLCELDELKEGEGKSVEIDGHRLAVFLHEGRVSVIDDRCPHAGASLSAGWIDRGCAVCPLHAWAFDLRDGKLQGTGAVGVDVYASRAIDHDGKKLIQADVPMP